MERSSRKSSINSSRKSLRKSLRESIELNKDYITPEESVSLLIITHGDLPFVINKTKRSLLFNYKLVDSTKLNNLIKLHRVFKAGKGSFGILNVKEENDVYKLLMSNKYKNIFSEKFFYNMYHNLEHSSIREEPSSLIKRKDSELKKINKELHLYYDSSNILKIKKDMLIGLIDENDELDPSGKITRRKLKRLKNKNNDVKWNQVINKIYSVDEPLFMKIGETSLQETINNMIKDNSNIISIRDDVTITYPIPIETTISDFLYENLINFEIFQEIDLHMFLDNIYYKIGEPSFKETKDDMNIYTIKYKSKTNILSCPYFIVFYLYYIEQFGKVTEKTELRFTNSYDNLPENYDYYKHLCVNHPEIVMKINVDLKDILNRKMSREEFLEILDNNKITKEDYDNVNKNDIIPDKSIFISNINTIRTPMLNAVDLQSLIYYFQSHANNNMYILDTSCETLQVNKQTRNIYNSFEKKVQKLPSKTRKRKIYNRLLEYVKDDNIRGGK